MFSSNSTFLMYTFFFESVYFQLQDSPLRFFPLVVFNDSFACFYFPIFLTLYHLLNSYFVQAYSYFMHTPYLTIIIYLPCAILEFSCTIPDKATLRKTILKLYRFLLCPEHTPTFFHFPLHKKLHVEKTIQCEYCTSI